MASTPPPSPKEKGTRSFRDALYSKVALFISYANTHFWVFPPILHTYYTLA